MASTFDTLIQGQLPGLNHKKQPKKGVHINNSEKELLGELYQHSRKGHAFINRFGHVEYMNKSFGHILMTDRSDKPLANLMNLNQLPFETWVEDKILHFKYPNGQIHLFEYEFKVINFQRSLLLHIILNDITDAHYMQRAIRDERRKWNDYFLHMDNPMFIFDHLGAVLDVPKSALKLFDQPMNRLKDNNIFEVLPFDYASQIMEPTSKLTDRLSSHFLYKSEKNKIITVYDTTIYYLQENRFMCHIKDVSDLNTMSSTIEYLNAYDSLTGFYNRTYFEQEQSRLNDQGNLPIGIYLLTIHGLKNLNRTLSYPECDRYLIDVALDIKSSLSQYEIPCRISGDTFVVLFPHCAPNTLEQFKETLNKKLTKKRADFPSHLISYTHKFIWVKDKQDDLFTLIKSHLY